MSFFNQIPNIKLSLNTREEIKRKRKQFTLDEDKILKSVVPLMKFNDWNFVASFLPNRTGRQCKDRWNKYLSPRILNTIWTEDEDQLLMRLINKFGFKWAKISKCMVGRSDIHIKNRYKQITAGTSNFFNNNEKNMNNNDNPIEDNAISALSLSNNIGNETCNNEKSINEENNKRKTINNNCKDCLIDDINSNYCHNNNKDCNNKDCNNNVCNNNVCISNECNNNECNNNECNNNECNKNECKNNDCNNNDCNRSNLALNRCIISPKTKNDQAILNKFDQKCYNQLNDWITNPANEEINNRNITIMKSNNENRIKLKKNSKFEPLIDQAALPFETNSIKHLDEFFQSLLNQKRIA